MKNFLAYLNLKSFLLIVLLCNNSLLSSHEMSKRLQFVQEEYSLDENVSNNFNSGFFDLNDQTIQEIAHNISWNNERPVKMEHYDLVADALISALKYGYKKDGQQVVFDKTVYSLLDRSALFRIFYDSCYKIKDKVNNSSSSNFIPFSSIQLNHIQLRLLIALYRQAFNKKNREIITIANIVLFNLFHDNQNMNLLSAIENVFNTEDEDDNDQNKRSYNRKKSILKELSWYQDNGQDFLKNNAIYEQKSFYEQELRAIADILLSTGVQEESSLYKDIYCFCADLIISGIIKGEKHDQVYQALAEITARPEVIIIKKELKKRDPIVTYTAKIEDFFVPEVEETEYDLKAPALDVIDFNEEDDESEEDPDFIQKQNMHLNIPVSYDQRIDEWFFHPQAALINQGYKGKNGIKFKKDLLKKLGEDKIIANHRFPKIIDPFIMSNQFLIPEQQKDNTFMIRAFGYYKDANSKMRRFGNFEIVYEIKKIKKHNKKNKNKENRVVFHRFFRESDKVNADLENVLTEEYLTECETIGAMAEGDAWIHKNEHEQWKAHADDEENAVIVSHQKDHNFYVLLFDQAFYHE